MSSHVRVDVDLLTVLHDIDNYKERVCATCHFYGQQGFKWCRKGYKPAAGRDGRKDGCDEWNARLRPAAGGRIEAPRRSEKAA